VEVMVKVTVLLFRPFKNEILDAVVSVVNNVSDVMP
jgi:DNA-directed RNA polymerase subunit E'/Rpb7